LKNLDTVLLGDRVQVRKAGIGEGRLFMDLLQAGPEDAMCCPGELAIKAWSLKNDKLVPMQATSAPVRLSLEAIDDSEWVLRWWDLEEKAPNEPEVTLLHSEGRLAGGSGCNRYFTVPESGEQPGDLALGPVGGTMMVCPDHAMDVERRFLGQLEGVKKFGFMAGMLALTYEVDARHGVMLFEGRKPEKSE
jgi:heat shock protein HslJ